MLDQAEAVNASSQMAGGRVFLFLQGPHGPFFRRLGKALERQGAAIIRVAFNASDAAAWRGTGPLLAFSGDAKAFGGWLSAAIAVRGVTDLVVYGDTRPLHRIAIQVASVHGLTTHRLEEGYLRPYWITYERQGLNGASPLCCYPLLVGAGRAEPDVMEELPTRWGDALAHRLHAIAYHARLFLPSMRYGRQATDGRSRLGEASSYIRRALLLPWIRLRRGLARLALDRLPQRYHMVLLQLSFDSAVTEHSPYRQMAEVIEDCVAAFARSAARRGEVLVFKAHPFESGHDRLRAKMLAVARRHGVAGQVRFIDGGTKLARLLDGALSVVTINSTAGQQALWRGKPVKALGQAVYARRGLVSDQPLAAFFDAPQPPDMDLYRHFRALMLRYTQLPGSFYARPGIDRLLERLPGVMLDPADPYDRGVSPVGARARRDMSDATVHFPQSGLAPPHSDPAAA
ncbi:MAG: capsule biosynthesis protein CapA [Pseudomonadota bacterium]